MTDRLVLPAPAKINLHLRVGPRDPATGFHPLASWMVTVGLFDILSIARAAGGINFDCDDASLPRDARNLVVKAATQVLRRANRPAGVELFLRKKIPAAAGLGGGSSDAAATITGLDRLLDLSLPAAEKSQIAADLGSDVPFFLAPPSAWCTGRGELITPLPAPARAKWAVLFFPPLGLSTADVYRRFDAMHLGRMEDLAPPDDLKDWPNLPAAQLLPRLVNDLESPAFDLSREVSELRDAIEAFLQRRVRMSGSGSTLFTLYDDAEEARAVSGKTRPRLRVASAVAEIAPRLDLIEPDAGAVA